jgi:hypothetical protein
VREGSEISTAAEVEASEGTHKRKHLRLGLGFRV